MNASGFKSIFCLCAALLGLSCLLNVSLSAQGGGNLGLCLTRNGTVARAAILYAGDHNDRLPPSVSNVTVPCAQTNYFGNAVRPYHDSWLNYRCPEDDLAEFALSQDECGPSSRFGSRAQLLTNWALKSHRGYNWLMLAPVVNAPGVSGVSHPIRIGEIADPSNSIMLVDSIWDRSPQGNPTGGGNFAVDAPCFRDINGALILPFPPGTTTYYWLGAWNPGTLQWNEFGGTWPWHKVWVGAMIDGSARTFTHVELTAGCTVLEGGTGRIFDMAAYLWDTRE